MNLFSITGLEEAQALSKKSNVLEFNQFVKLLPSLTSWIVSATLTKTDDVDAVIAFDPQNRGVRLILNLDAYQEVPDAEWLLRYVFGQKDAITNWLIQCIDIETGLIDWASTRIIIVNSEFSASFLEATEALKFVELWRTDLYEGDILNLEVFHHNPSFLCTGWECHGFVESESTILLNLIEHIEPSEVSKSKQNLLPDPADFVHIVQRSSFLAVERTLEVHSNGLDATLGFSQPYKSKNMSEVVASKEELVAWLNSLSISTPIRLATRTDSKLNAEADGQVAPNLPGDAMHCSTVVLGYDVPAQCVQVPAQVLRECIFACSPSLEAHPTLDDRKQFLELEIGYQHGQGTMVALASNGYSMMRMKQTFDCDSDLSKSLTFSIPAVCVHELQRLLNVYDGIVKLGKLSSGEWIGVGNHYLRYPFPRNKALNYQTVLDKVKQLPCVGAISSSDLYSVIDLESAQLQRKDVKYLMLKKVSQQLFAFLFLNSEHTPRCTQIDAKFAPDLRRDKKFEVLLNPAILCHGIQHLLHDQAGLEVFWSSDTQGPICFKPQSKQGWVYMLMPTAE